MSALSAVKESVVSATSSLSATLVIIIPEFLAAPTIFPAHSVTSVLTVQISKTVQRAGVAYAATVGSMMRLVL
jgi:hypothetical protein